MDAKFWFDRWAQGQIGFHRSDYNDKLVQHFSQLHAIRGQSILVPLCGKTKDMAWLQHQGLKVRGVELSEEAANAFFVENAFEPPRRSAAPGQVDLTSGEVTITCGDIFEIALGSFDLGYDRAALVALPPAMRQVYAAKISAAIRPGGRCLLISYEYDQTKMDGPPFSVEEPEIHSLYAKEFAIRQLERVVLAEEGTRLAALDRAIQAVYLLERHDRPMA